MLSDQRQAHGRGVEPYYVLMHLLALGAFWRTVIANEDGGPALS